jgi:hypothetical protein
LTVVSSGESVPLQYECNNAVRQQSTLPVMVQY